MAELMHNQTIRLSGELEGIYRIVLFDSARNLAILVCLAPLVSTPTTTSKSTKEHQQNKRPAPLCGALTWTEAETLLSLLHNGELTVIEIERENFKTSPASQKRYERRVTVMSKFLEIDTLCDSILAHHNLGELVRQALNEHGVSRYFVYHCWSMLCRYGFTEESLQSRYDRCGAAGVRRDCSPGGNKKAGRKTIKERLQQQAGVPVITAQPGMTAHWRNLILTEDKKIPTPKPRLATRYTKILTGAFVKDYLEKDGVLVAQQLKKGEYPNKRQVKRVLEVEVPRLQRLMEATTKGHFARSQRGLTGRNWEGVAGPGHTWAIDSTIGDIYLRSSINRAWVIGRPIVYVMVDVWSTAVVGLHVCLRGPSWDTAKVALFNAVADPTLMTELMGFEFSLGLNPSPTLPYVLLCDRGEYLSKAATITALKLLPCLSYTPPYRPDLKGLVEVLHRIGKDHQQWVPGAIDARRKEFELRKFDPNTGIFTVQEYIQYLINLFTEYNLTADRTNRLDTKMIADGVFPSPAGLWRWGHEMGIGVTRNTEQSQLIRTLLPKAEASVGRSGIALAKLNYRSAETIDAAWTAEARNFGAWRIPVHHYPGTVSRIWTPNMAGAGLLELHLTDQANASPEQTFEEVEDAVAFNKLAKDEQEHYRTGIKVNKHLQNEELVERAKDSTAQALAQHDGEKRALRQSRKEEQSREATPAYAASAPPSPQTASVSNDKGEDAYLEMMKSILVDVKRKQI